MVEAKAIIEFEPVWVPEEQIIIPLVKAPDKPIIPYIYPGLELQKKRLIINIETNGLRPLEHRIIAIGLQDPLFPETEPSIIMMKSEASMISTLFTIIQEGDYEELVGYGLSFDFRFLLIRAMKYDLTCKDFFEMSLYDLMQGMAQVRMEYVYFPQRPLKLSDIADFFWEYPKPFSDVELIKYYMIGDTAKVREFATSQINRIMALYQLFEKTINLDHSPKLFSGIASEVTSLPKTLRTTESLLTIPEAHQPETWIAKCSNCLAEYNIPIDQSTKVCEICGETIRRN